MAYEKKVMIADIRAMIAVCIFGLLAGSASGAVITFDKSLDVPDRDFNVTYEGSTFSFTIADIGNYKIGEDVNINVSGGANNMRLVLFSVDKLTPWWKTFYNTSGSVSTTIPANRFNSSCPDVCDDNIMGPGIYALAVQNRDVDPAQYILAKPVIVSDYTISVTPGSTQASPGSVLKVTVAVSKNGAPVSVAPNNVNVTFVQDSTSTHFEGTAAATATTGTYEANIQVPSTASGSYKLYSAITTNRNIYQDYPEIIGAAGYTGTIDVSTPTSTPPADVIKPKSKIPRKQIAGKLEILFLPENPTAYDNMSMEIRLTYPTAGYKVKFGNVSIENNTITVNIDSEEPKGIAAQAITTYSEKYDLFSLGEGSYTLEVYINGALSEVKRLTRLPVNMENTVKVVLAQGSSKETNATNKKTGESEAQIEIPQPANGTFSLYSVMTIERKVYMDYPEIIGVENPEKLEVESGGYKEVQTFSEKKTPFVSGIITVFILLSISWFNRRRL